MDVSGYEQILGSPFGTVSTCRSLFGVQVGPEHGVELRGPSRGVRGARGVTPRGAVWGPREHRGGRAGSRKR